MPPDAGFATCNRTVPGAGRVGTNASSRLGVTHHRPIGRYGGTFPPGGVTNGPCCSTQSGPTWTIFILPRYPAGASVSVLIVELAFLWCLRRHLPRHWVVVFLVP